MVNWSFATLGEKSPQVIKKKRKEATSKSAIAEKEAGDSTYAEIGPTETGNLSMCKIADALKKVSDKLYHNCDQSTVMKPKTISHTPGHERPALPFREGDYESNPLIQEQSQREQIPPAPLRERPREGSYDTLKPDEVLKAQNANAEVLDLLESAHNINITASEALKELQEAFNALYVVAEGKEAPREFITTAIQKLNKATQAKKEAQTIANMKVEEQKTKAETALITYNKKMERKQKYIKEIESYISTITLKQTGLQTEQTLATENISKIENAVTQARLIKQRFINQFDAETLYITAVEAEEAPAAPELGQLVRSDILPEPTIEGEIFEKASKGAQAAAAAKAAAEKPPEATTAERAFGGGSRKLTKKRKTKKGKKSRKSTKKGKSRKSKLAKQKYKKGKKSKMRKKYNKKTKRVNNNNTNTKK
jgi:hypothetical protein